jgi:hypothetical protein
MSAIGDERFFRNPDRQLRDRGASPPDVSFSQNDSSLSRRHPVIVTAVESWAWTPAFGRGATAAAGGAGSAADAREADATTTTRGDSAASVALAVAAGGAGSGADAREAAAIATTCGDWTAGAVLTAEVVAGALDAAPFGVSSRVMAVSIGGVSACGRASALAISAWTDGWRAAISATAATAHITPKAIGQKLVADGTCVEFLVPAVFFDRVDRDGFFTFFTRSGILLREIFRSLWSAESRY